MTITETIDTQISEFARAFEANSAEVASHTPPPVDVLVRRIGALNAEAIRQSGHVAATAINAAAGLATTAWRGASDVATSGEQAVTASADTVRATGRRATGDAKQASSSITNRARSAAGQIGRNLRAVSGVADDVGDDVGRQGRAAGRRVAKAADTATAETAAAGTDRPTGPYENWTREELYERAQELDIDGRSRMSKDQLVTALRRA